MTTSNSFDRQLLLHISDVAKLLGITPRTVYRWLNEGKIQGRKVGRSWRISKQAISDLIGEALEVEGATTHITPARFGKGEHFLALAPEREAISGVMAKLTEIALQQSHNVFAGCWSQSPNELRQLMRALGIPSDMLEAEGTLTISDFSAVLDSNGVEGILQEWQRLIVTHQQDDIPLWAIGTPSLDCWDEEPGRLVEFEAALDALLHESNMVSICIYPLPDFVPARLPRLGTLISKHTGLLLWSETELMALRPDNFSQLS